MPVQKFKNVVIIYNPNSTGDSEKLARTFADLAKKQFKTAKVQLIATKFVAHGEEIAAKLAKQKGKTLLVSSSGDGGYHEVINGLMAAKGPLGSVTAAVLPAGNANDHSRTMHEAPLTERLNKAKQIRIDLLKVTVNQSSGKTIRFAHSYVGLGFTPQVARELNKHQLNSAKEIYLVLKTFKRFKPFQIRHKRKILTLDSLIFSNINQMAKVLTLADKNRPRDGRFEVVMIKHRNKAQLLAKFIKGTVSWLRPQRRAVRYVFSTLQSMPMQLDGEVIKLEKDAKVIVSIAPRALKTLI